MTELQRKIQKSSRWVSFGFALFLIRPFFKMIEKFCIGLGQLFGSEAILRLTENQAPDVNIFQAGIYNLAGILLYLFVFYAYYQLWEIFRNISREYTPFCPIHVKRLRRSALAFTASFVYEMGLDIWIYLLRPELGFQLHLQRYLIPVLIFSFSFILDYACQLQAEADTTL